MIHENDLFSNYYRYIPTFYEGNFRSSSNESTVKKWAILSIILSFLVKISTLLPFPVESSHSKNSKEQQGVRTQVRF